MKVGDTLEAAIWLDGCETPEMRALFMKTGRQAFEDTGAVIGPVTWVEKYPGEDRVPPVPDHVQGPDVRLLVVEATVIALSSPDSMFLDELEPDDLRRLRRITRRAYAKMFPKRALLTDRQCDTLINDLGPDSAAEALQAGEADVARVLH